MKPKSFMPFMAMIIIMVLGRIQISYAQDQIYTTPDKIALYPGGSIAIAKFLKANIKYPDAAKAAKITGTVTVSFIVEISGGLTNLQVIKGIGGGCDEEAIRVIRKMPKWFPGTVQGQEVRTVYKLNIKFPQP